MIMIKSATLLTILTFALVPIYQSKPIYKSIENDSILIGEWVIAAFGNVGNDSRVLWGQCNACSHICFYKNGQGVIKDADGYGTSTSVIWSLKSSKLLFRFTQKQRRYGLVKGNLQYISSYSVTGKNQKIILLDARKNFELMLIRTVDR